MAIRRLIWFAILLHTPVSAWPSEKNAVAEYLRPILSEIASDPNIGGWTWETNGNGGYLLRMEVDVTGDGRPELFVASSLTAVKHDAEWAVFDVSDTGVLRPFDRTVIFPADSVWADSASKGGGLTYVAPPDREREKRSDEKSYPVYRFGFQFPRVTETLAYASSEDVDKLRPANPESLPRLQSILLADYLTKPSAPWTDVKEWSTDSRDSFFQPGEQERAARNTVFTPEVALSRLKDAPSALSAGGRSSKGNSQFPKH